MILLEAGKPALISDRRNAQALYGKEEEMKFEKTLGTRYVMAVGSELDSEHLGGDGTFIAVMNDNFTVKGGSFLVIHAFGYTSVEQRLIRLSDTPFPGHQMLGDGCSTMRLLDGVGPRVDYFFMNHAEDFEQRVDEWQVNLVIGGEAACYVKPEGFRLQQGHAFVMPRMQKHRYQSFSNPFGLLRLSFHG